MRPSALFALSGLAMLGIASCSDHDGRAAKDYGEGATAEGYGKNSGPGEQAGSATPSNWPQGSRIIVEEGVTFRVEPGGTRIRLGPTDSRILVEDGVTYRLDPDGTRVRIDSSGAQIRIGGDAPETDPDPAEERSVEVNTL